MDNHSEDKAKRILAIYTRLRQRKIVYKAEMSETYGVSQRTIQRDITDIQCFLQDLCMETGSIQEIVFDKDKGGYLLQSKQNHFLSEKEVWGSCGVKVKQNYCLRGKDILAICRILLGSESLVKAELFPIMNSLIALCSGSQSVIVEKMLQDGMENYVEPRHGRRLIEQLWDLENAVKGKKNIEIEYGSSKEGGRIRERVRPVRVLYVESCFYLVASVMDEDQTEVKEEKRGGLKKKNEHGFYQIERILECTIVKE